MKTTRTQNLCVAQDDIVFVIHGEVGGLRALAELDAFALNCPLEVQCRNVSCDELAYDGAVVLRDCGDDESIMVTIPHGIKASCFVFVFVRDLQFDMDLWRWRHRANDEVALA